MAIFVDFLQTHPVEAFQGKSDVLKHGRTWCHMFSDNSVEELVNFAKTIGLKEEWLQKRESLPHFDLTPKMYKKALKAGATKIESWKDLSEVFKKIGEILQQKG